MDFKNPHNEIQVQWEKAQDGKNRKQSLDTKVKPGTYFHFEEKPLSEFRGDFSPLNS